MLRDLEGGVGMFSKRVYGYELEEEVYLVHPFLLLRHLRRRIQRGT